MYSGKLFISADELSKEDIKKYKLLAINSNIDRLIFSTSEENWKEGALEKLNKLEEELGNYNAEGISYMIDVTEDVGKRIKELKFLQTGKPLEMNQIYKVAINSYRANGGGGHINAAGSKNAPIIFQSSEEMRNILTDYIKNIGTIAPETDQNWKIVTGK